MSLQLEVLNMGKLKSYKCIWVNGKLERLHRYKMEQHLGRKLRENEVVHHIDGNKWNNAIENLDVKTRSEHMNHHRKDLKPKINTFVKKCSACGIEKQMHLSTLLNCSTEYKCRKCYESKA